MHELEHVTNIVDRILADAWALGMRISASAAQEEMDDGSINDRQIAGQMVVRFIATAVVANIAACGASVWLRAASPSIPPPIGNCRAACYHELVCRLAKQMALKLCFGLRSPQSYSTVLQLLCDCKLDANSGYPTVDVERFGLNVIDEICKGNDLPINETIAMIVDDECSVDVDCSLRLAADCDLLNCDLDSLGVHVQKEGAIARKLALAENASPSTKARGTAKGKTDTAAKYEWLARAMLIVRDHPERSNSDIAKEVGRHPSTLSRSPEYRAAAAFARASRNGVHRGHIVNRNGQLDVEAYCEDPNRDGD